MPIYTYVCSKEPNEQVEKNVKIADRDDQFCVCKAKLKRLIDSPGAVYAPTSKNGLAT